MIISMEVFFMRIEKKENVNGGVGPIYMKHILEENQKNAKTKLFAEVTIPSGSVLGYHEHHGESETYYIISGEGEYNDNGTIRPVKAGDMTFTPNGSGHGMSNTSKNDLVFIALIQLD